MTANELSPLDQIRLAEAEMTRHLVATREAAEQTVAEARTSAAQRKAEAIKAGIMEGDALYKSMVARAEEEAQVIIVQAHHHAAGLRQMGHQRMAKAVLLAINMVVGMEAIGKTNER